MMTNAVELVRGFGVVSAYQKEDDIIMPVRATKLAAGYDIFNNTGSEIIIEPGELSEPISTKIFAYMQNDEVLLLLPRSGHGFKYSVRLANTVGVIDADYRFSKNEGEIFVKLHNQGEKQLRIKAKESFGQGIFVKYLLIDGDDFTKGADRDGGLGSTSK